MAGIKELRLRITSVGNIKQITRAMEMVATTKLRRFQDRATSSRPYAEEITALVGRLAAMLGEGVEDRPLFRAGKGEKTLALVVTSDRGLCGAYNSNLLKMIEAWRADLGRPVDYLVYGRKGFGYMNKRDFEIKSYLQEPPLEQIDYRSAALVGRILVEDFLSGEYRDVVLITTRFQSMVKYVPQIVPFLPIRGETLADGGGEAQSKSLEGGVILEPDAESIFERLLPRYLETRVFNALLEALASEYASRRFAMKNATDAATDMQNALRGVYNRKRQETITKELLDIVGGAEAIQ